MTLAASQLRFAYDAERWVVRDVAIETRPGEMLGVIGPNGSGKSTLLRLLAGLLAPASGAVEVDGLSVGDLKRLELARRVAFLPQAVQPAFAFTCEEVVAQGRYPHQGVFGFANARDLQVARRCMALTDVEEFARRPLSELSGGERQRVLIASVLAQEAPYLLLDEPTAALDIHHQAAVFQLLRESTRRDGTAVAVVVHDLNLSAQFCDRLVLMSAGELVAEGTARDVLTEERLTAVYGGNIAVGENAQSGTPLVTALWDRGEKG